MLSCAMLALASVVSVHAENGFIDTTQINICSGDTVRIVMSNSKPVTFYKDTIVYDTIHVTKATDDSIHKYIARVLPVYSFVEPARSLPLSGTLEWRGLTITEPGTYQQVYKTTTYECDSIYRVDIYRTLEEEEHRRICFGDSTEWRGRWYRNAGVFTDVVRTHDNLRDSILYRLRLEVKPIPVTEVSHSICRGSYYDWRGRRLTEKGIYTDTLVATDLGCDSILRLTLNFLDEDATFAPVEVEKYFSICDDESVTFNGQTYRSAGTFYDRFTCDTIYKIVITKNPTSLHYQTGVLIGSNPFYWTYQYNGEQKTDTLTAPGRYEYTTVNEETGCNDSWVLELTKDATSYHFVEEKIICANEPFSWRGRENLNQQGIGQTIHYFDNYRTISDQDSIYELILTVKPVLTSTQTIKYCGSITVHGATYSESKVLVDTFTSAQYNCDSIVTTILVKGEAFHLHDTLTLVPGETATWRGQTINHDGIYEERHTSSFGCDSIYSLGVGYKAATPVTNTHTDKVAICEGNYYEWRGDKYFNSGIFNDTVYVNGDAAQGIDSIYILNLTVNPIYHSTERITFTSFPATYREHIFAAPGGYWDFRYQSSTGCDSIITVYADLQVITHEETASVCRSELPYRWRDHEFYESYRYVETVKDGAGNDSVQYILNLTVKDNVETRITQTICEGGSYTFGDRVLTETGVYRYIFHDFGCDSLVVLSLNVLKPDTNRFIHHMDDGQYYDWNGTRYTETGVYYDYRTNRFGCDSINILELTVNHVDTVDTTAVICPNEIPFFWHGIRAYQTNDYTNIEQSTTGEYTYYRLHLTVREIVNIDTTFTICGDESVSFNGKTYSQGGKFYDYLSCDTLVEINIVKRPQQVYETTASLGGDHGYTWTYWDNGTEQTQTFNEPGTYEYESPNATTGCSELWRLILSKDETEYHFIQDTTICEGDDFSWHGMDNLSHQGIGVISNYFVKYQTRTGKDSIYELRLKVEPLKRTTKIIPFCESYTLNGQTYTSSTTVIERLASSTGCDSVVTYMLQKGSSFHRHDTATIIPGETLNWRGQLITNTGLYTDSYTSSTGCDSIYTLGVGMKEDAPHMKMRTWNEDICEGDTLTWRNKNYFNTGTYVDTLYVGSTNIVDSLYVLNLTVHPTYYIRERITFHSFPAEYRGYTFSEGETHEFHYTTADGHCDSIIAVVAELEVTRTEETVTICDGDTYIWKWNGSTYTESGRYVVTVKDGLGNDSVEHILNLTVRYIPETFVTKTICKGGSYTFGDRTLTEAGVYDYTFQSGTCDSLVHLSLNVVNADTNILVHHMNAGETFSWGGQIYSETGTYFQYGTNRFGCDSVSVLELTINHVDTVDTTLTICPNEIPFVWHGISASQTGDYQRAEKKTDGSYNFYRLHLTVREITRIDTTFTICDDEQVIFNGQTFSQGGTFTTYLSCDTLIYVHINKHPQQVYETRAALGQDKYTWTFGPAGQTQTVEYSTPGTYEFEFPNAVTGCSELWRLILSQDMDEYHFEETLTICEGADFSWHGKENLSHQFIGETHDYTAEYKTRNGKDSIYTLHLTVTPIQRTYRTIRFCGETEYKGIRYTNSAQVYDTLTAANGCDSIILINLDKAQSYHFYETKDLPQGTVYKWRDKYDIYTDGVYTDPYVTEFGCDSIYELRVTIIPATPQTNQYSEEWSICSGDSVLWRGKDLWRPGQYVDTVWSAGKEKVDSIFTLNLIVWPSYRDTIIRHLYNCNEGAIQYNGKLFTQDTALVSVFSTSQGCDSIEKVFMHFNMVLNQSDTVKISDKQLPYTWNYTLGGVTRDTVLTNAGTYYHTEKTQGGCYNQEELVLIVYPTYLFQLDTTICETKLPFKWQSGPADHQNDDLYGEVGTTKMIEYRYNSVNNTDSIYRLNLTVDAAPKATEYHWVCSGTPELIRGKVYGNTTATMDTIYRDTINQSDPNGSCDSIIYLEVFVSSLKQHKETRVLYQGETIVWGDYTIERGGDYSDTTKTANGCDSISILHVVEEMRIEKTICRTDTMEDTPADKKYPYVWVHQRPDIPNDTLYTSGIYTSTVENETTGMLEEYYSLHLTIVHPYDTTIYVHGCQNKGAWWYGQPNEIFHNDTAFIYRKEVSPADPNAPCDSIFYVNVKIDTIYDYHFKDTICEQYLPYIFGRVNPDTLWEEGTWRHTFDTTSCGCDSIITVDLRIIPEITKNDSTFICEEEIAVNPVVLGNLVNPKFDEYNGGTFHGKWEGKWKGVSYTKDTIVWNCDSSYYHHIIVRPKQDVPAKDTFYLCQGDSVQLFWPYKEDWVYTEGVYRDTVKTYSAFMDETHGTTHYDKNFLCDSIIEWTVFMLDTIHEDTVVHIAMGDSLFWNNEWRYATGLYDSISYDGVPGVGPTAIQGANGLDLPVIDSRGQYCKYVMTLHLFVDSTYHFRDTLSACEFKNKDTLYIWADGHETEFRLPSHDTAYHLIDTLPTLLYRFDSIYDLYVDYHQKYFTQIYDTICEGTEYRFDAHHHDNTQTSRLLTLKGVYYDTIPALNGCDSIIELYLETRDSIKTTHKSLTITDRDIPYYWTNTWKKLDGTDTTQVDTLRSTGIYSITMWNKFGCDSTIVLDFTVHQTNVFRDTLEICEFSNTTVTYPWPTNFESRFNTPNQDSAHFHVYDTLPTRVYLDSIYDLYVIFKQKTILYKDTNICFGDSIQFGLTRAHTQRFIHKSGIYQDTLVRTTNGCDSIIELRVNVRDIYASEVTKHISIADTPYIWTHIGTGGLVLPSDTLYADGTYIHRFESQYGCDSIDTLHLFIHQQYLYRDTVQICADETPYEWGNKKDIYTTGEYIQNFRTADGMADSTHVRYVRVMPVEHDTIQAWICEGDSMRFGLTKANKPRFLYTSGLYNDTLTSIHGCDSIITLRLNVFPRYMKDTTVHIADVDTPYVWKHYQSGTLIDTDSLYITGHYGYNFHSQYGCDSIDSLHLFIHQTYQIADDTINICANEVPFTWRGLDNITATGDYIYGEQTIEGYDSIHTVHINVWKQVYDTITAFICEGDSMRWGLTKANQPRYVHLNGLYNDTLTSVHGCDSIIVLRLNVYPRYMKDTTVHIADVDTPYVWKHYRSGTLIDTDSLYAEGRYGYRFPTQFGCDSIDSLTLIIHPTYEFHDTVTICYNETPYTWYNADSSEVFKNDIYTTGTYYKYLQTKDLYDSIYVRYVRVIPVITDTVRHSMCEGSEYSFNGVRYTKGGTYTDTLRSNLGCDSIVTLLLTVNKPVYIHIPVDIYEGESYMFYGQPYTTSGTYRHSAVTPEGCDSITELFLTVHPQVDTIVTLCTSELPYMWVNKWSGEQKPLYTAGTYRDDTTYVNGKRTFYTLQLIVNQPVQDTIRVSICEGESYQFKGEALTTTGIYRDTVRAANGCDSVINLVLTVNQPYYNYQVQHIIEGQTVSFFGTDYSTTGTYTHFGTTPEGCDSTSILQLIVHRMVDTVVTVCSPELPYMWINKWDGSVTPLYTAGIYRNDTTYYQGEKMYYGLQLVVNDPVLDTTRVAICQGSSYRFKGMDLTEPGLYRDTLRAANGCDSIETLVLSVNAPYFNAIREDVLQGQTVDFFGQTYSTTGTYYHYAHTPEGCDSTTVLELVVHPLVDTIVTICKNDLPFLWNNRWSNNEEAYYAAGTYRNDTTINGEKRFFGLELRVNEQTFDTTRVAICQGGSYLYKGEYLTASGIYRDTVQAPNGCDSIHTLILTVNKPYFNTIHEDVLQGQKVVFFGDTLSTTGTYYHYAHTPEGCDSTTVLELVVHPLVDTIVTICKNDLPFIWNNRWSNNQEAYYAAGTYRNDTTINGGKRFFGLELRVNEQTFDTTRVAICQGSSYRYQGKDLTVAGIYRDTTQGKNGCDSIHTLVLTVNKAYYNYQVQHIIEGQKIVFFGDTFSTTGTYYHFGTTPEGCDSTSVLQLNVHAAVDTVVYVCSNNLPYLWVNKWDNSIVTPLYTEGTYRNDSVIVNGERMFYGLQLFIKQPTETTIYREICEGDMYNFNGKMLSTGGEYRDTVLNSIGCDSVIILHLNVLKKYYNTVTRTIFEGDTVMFLGQSYSAAGNYPIRYTSSFGCDSIVELQLSVKRMFDDSVTVCANELPLTWQNRIIYESGIYRDTSVVDGKEVIIGLKVNVLPIARASEPIVATICEGDFYKFGDSVLTKQGTYYDTLTAVNGCDSIVMLALQVLPVKYQTTTKRIFEGDTVFFYGDTLTKSGVYEHRVLNANNCTDTYQMILTVLKESHIDTSAVICKNDLPFIWRGYEYNETGDYRLPITWTDSSRVVMTLHLTVNDTYYAERNVSLCSGDYFKFKGITYTENGFFYDTIPSLVGCDSIIKYVISVHPTYDHIFEKHVSDKQPYIFHGRELTTSGTYEWTGKTQNGCDSLEHLILTVHPSYFFSDTVDICQSDSLNYPYKWRNFDISQTGVYSDSMLTDTYGFDSVFQLVVHVWPAYMTNEQYEIGEGEVLKIHGRDISKPAIYYDTLRTIHGCDSIFHVVVNQKRTREFFWTREICQGDYFEFLDGRKLTHTGQYKYVSQYKDSVVTLNLTVNPKSITEKRIVITPAQLPYIVEGHLFDKDTIHVDTLVNQYGCDSLYRIVLVTTTHYSEWTPIPLCPGAELKIDGQVITEPGLYTYLRRSKVTGEMDSIYRVEVYDAPSYERTLERTICEGDTIMMGGKPYTHSGTFVYRGQTVDGCDSIETLILTVNPSYHFDTAVTIMDDQSFYWRGKTYNKTGMYYNSYQTELGCDSTYSLKLHVVETEYHHIDDTICNGQIYVWRGDTLTMDGYYTQIVRDTLHKFSAVYTLRLVVTYPTTITKAKTGDICADAESFDIEFEFAGKKPLSYSVIFDALAKREGFQDIYNAPLGTDMIAHIDLPKYSSVVYQGHTNYVRPDYYTMRLVLDNGVCGTSRSDSLKLLIKYPTWIIEQNWGDVVAPLKAELNGGYEFSQTEWYVNGVLQPNDGLGYLHSDKLRAGDQVVMMATRKGDNYAIPTCPLTITTPLPNTNPYPILVYPTQAPRYAPNITISAPLEGQFEVYSSTGMIIMTGEFGEGETIVTLPSVSGIYFIRTTQGTETETHKVILL